VQRAIVNGKSKLPDGNDNQLIVHSLMRLLHPNGTLPSTLISRVDTVGRLVSQPVSSSNLFHPKIPLLSSPDCIIFSGSEVQKCGKSEALAMFEYFKSKLGCTDKTHTRVFPMESNSTLQYYELPQTTVILEEQSKNTLENFLYTSKILKRIVKEGNPPPVVYIVTNDFHCPRALLLGKHILKQFPCFAIPASSILPRTSSSFPSITTPSSTLAQSLMWENRALKKVNEQLKQYAFPPISEEDIALSLIQLERVSQSYNEDIKIDCN
jgi:uncharacterized SAM-binding protein YcdF (DUF218 family)